MSGPRVSVIVCAYNAADTIAQCLESLFAQTAPDFEILVVDDGSTDGTAAVTERLAAGSLVPTRLVRTAHEGLAGARNRGIAEGGGEYVAFVDADDTAEPAMIEHMLACADSAAADLVVCDMLYVDFQTGAVLHTHHEGASSLFGGSLTQRPGLLAALGGSVCNKLVRRQLFEGSGITFPAGAVFEDLWVTYRLCGEAQCIAKVDEPLYRYRVGREGSIVSVYDDRYLEIADALAVTNEYFKAKGTFDALRESLLVLNYIHLVFGRYTNLLTSGSRSLRHRYLATAFRHMDRYFPGWRHAAAVRAVTGRWAKHVVFTHRILLTVFTDLKSGGSRR